MHIGFVGTGNIGNRFVKKLLEARHTVTVTDLRKAAAENLLALGARWAEWPADVARAAGTVLASLPNPSAVERVALDERAGVLDALPEGGVFVDMSTSPPALARRIAAAYAAKRRVALDAPVSNGGVFTTVGGDRATFERLRPVFEVISPGRVLYMGEAGQGQVAKLTRQYVSFVNFFTISEAIMIAARSGADVRAVLDFIGASTRHGDFWSRSFNSLFTGDFATPETAGAKLDIVSKDVHLALELAREAKAPANIGLPVADLLERGQAQGWGQYEYWIAVKVLEQMANHELRPPAKRE
ncbi:MAG: NAD(P)-dependent oxidoreductase [SAR202 cluster bacterium]|nr:NAD(P)-dependent oxidoreductase [SAR202 cluster bacterium]